MDVLRDQGGPESPCLERTGGMKKADLMVLFVSEDGEIDRSPECDLL